MKQIICGFVWLIFVAGCTGKEPISDFHPLRISVNSKVYISLQLQHVSDPFNFQFNYWPQFSTDRLQTPDYRITKDTSIIMELVAYKPKRYTLDVNGISIPVFAILDDTVGVVVNLDGEQIDYHLSNESVNNFLLANHKVYESNRTKMFQLYHQYDMPYQELYSKFDSIKSVECSMVTNEAKIPNWFRNLELQNIEFKIAHAKLSAANYRNFIESKVVDLPSEKDLEFLENLDLSSPYNQYLDEFNSFMNFYCFYLIYDRHFVIGDSVSRLFNDENLATTMFEACNKLGLPSKNLLVFAVNQTIGDIARNRVRKEGRIEYLTSMYGADHPFISHLIQENQKLEQVSLKAGDKAPYFSLEDLDGNPHSIENSKDKVVLLNFYTLGCVACYKEVPYEKELLRKYDAKEFQILNICVTGSAETFNKAVQKYNLDGVNLYTPGNWNNIMQKEYQIAGYPHYTLVDKEGLIVKNNTFRPSNPKLSNLLDTLLEKGS